ncbi:MAG: N-acetyltransferase [Bryobacteraceae bacterium]
MISALTPENIGEHPHGDLELDVRKAAMRDIAPVLSLINGYAAQGIMLPRTEFEMSEAIRDFSVVYAGSRLIGCGALHFYSPATGEIRSLAVDPEWKTHGVGRRVIEALAAEAEAYELHAVFAFTYVPGFFHKLGFEEVERGMLPLKVWKDCLRCPKFQCCDEIAVVRVLRPDQWAQAQCAQPHASEYDPGVLLPIVNITRTAR